MNADRVRQLRLQSSNRLMTAYNNGYAQGVKDMEEGNPMFAKHSADQIEARFWEVFYDRNPRFQGQAMTIVPSNYVSTISDGLARILEAANG